MEKIDSTMRDKWTLRKDVMILRQVVYKELMALQREVNQDKIRDGSEMAKVLTLTPEMKEWIDSQVAWFFSEMPQAILDEFHKEFSAPQSASKPKTKVEEKDLEGEGIFP